MIILTANAAEVFEWISNHIHIAGWAGLGVLAWKGRGYIDRFLAGVQLSDTRLQETKAIAQDVKDAVGLIQTNHLVHVEKEIGTLAGAQYKANELLASIDKNISILVDRGRAA